MATIKIWTMQMARWRIARDSNIEVLDITAKSGEPAFAPVYADVMKYKRGEILPKEYTTIYLERMERSKELFPAQWAKLKDYKEVAFVCYCKAGDFCHRHLFKEIVQEYLEDQDMKVIQMGELINAQVISTLKDQLDISIINRMNPRQLMSHYFLSAYCYYQLNESPLTDSAFDRLCKRLSKVYQTVEHPYKHLVSVEDLEAGTCLLAADKYPRNVTSLANKYLNDCTNGTTRKELEPYLSIHHDLT